jgi:hypothetical protein
MLNTYRPHSDPDTIRIGKPCSSCRIPIRIIMPEKDFFTGCILALGGACVEDAFPSLDSETHTTMVTGLCPRCRTPETTHA